MTNFLFKLQEQIQLREGIEGHLTILREIYRAGHISLHDLSNKTLIPISVLSKIVNYLIEKELLSRIPEGILYTEQGMRFVEEEFAFYGYGLPDCEECGGLPIYISPRWDTLLDKVENALQLRPKVDTTLDQAFADTETNILRALYLYKNGALEGKSICFLGDDDFTSVAVSWLYEGFFPEDPKLLPKAITIIDIDKRILDGIQTILKDELVSPSYVQWDYRKAVPKNLINKFDTVILDPPYTLNGLSLSISRSISILREVPGAQIYLSYAHRSPDELLEIQNIFTLNGLAIKEIIPRFNYYEGGGILGNITQIYQLITTQKTIPSISHDSIYTNEIYTGELNQNLRYYYCLNCKRLIPVGQTSKCKIKTIEELKESNCPYCSSFGPFELDHKEKESQNE